ncbi:deoxyribonuclease IV [Conexibacter woesei]|uniref:Probable endonuclease 4 n=1 Tax=Conexibacter woesei (strain DSM 14684 / CCUG 47730 / CIP 108061 / JCM 11494 / NBRC 100937 / ID131577) TaxID=469383 RepID=D3F0G2_CONWI|nr:deoxyribonuclease IV [Conexibacter woesei]ADB52022.1 apurinic endonuclease Apn1 [Conexibacter woesei DSM 14684]
MLIGAHVSQAGGLPNAIERGVEKGCTAIQIFNQSPRMWRPTQYSEDDFAAFRDAMAGSPIRAVMIHAVYLINCASEDPEIRTKSLASLTQSLRVGDAIGASVVLHPGSALRGHVGEAIARAGGVFREALAESESSALLLEDTAGAGGTLGRSFEELRELIDAAGGGERLGVCLDSCHLLASGYDVRTIDGLSETLDRFDAAVGLGRLGGLHLNDSVNALGTNRDRHANLGEGELGETGCMAFLSEPRFENLPVVLETPGPDKRGTSAEEIVYAKRLRRRGLRLRKKAAV